MPEPPSPEKSPTMAGPLGPGSFRASVVIPTLDRPDQLQECLQALQRVNSPIVVFLDDDCLPQEGWLEAGNRLVKAPGAVLSHLPKLNFARFWRKCSSYGEGAAKFHQSSTGNWRDESIAFHMRVPALASWEMSENSLERRFSLFALLLVWELANLTGFVKEKWKNRNPGKHNPGSGSSAP